MSSAGALGGVGFLADEMAAALATMYAGLASPRLAASEFGITAPLEVIEAQALSDAYEVARAAAQALPWLRDAQADAVASDDVGAVARTSAALIAGLAQVIATASALAPALATAAASLPVSHRAEMVELADALPARLIERALVAHLEHSRPRVAQVLYAAGVLTVEEVADGPVGSLATAYTRVNFHGDRLIRLVRDPLGLLRDVHGWGESTFDGVSTMRAIFDLWTRVARRPAQLLLPAGAPAGLELFVLALHVDNDAAPPGLVASVRSGAAVTVEQTGTEDDWAFGLAADIAVPIDLDVALRPPFTVAVETPTVSANVSLALTATRAETQPAFLLAGQAGGARIELHGAAAAAGVDVACPGGTAVALDPRATVSVRGVRVVVPPGDGFLAALTGGAGFDLRFDLDASWSPSAGLRLGGSAALVMDLPVRTGGSRARVDGVRITIGLDGDAVQADIEASATATLGPVTVAIGGAGLRGELAFPDGGGNLGPLHVTGGLRAPDRFGLGLNAGPVSGGGFIEGDESAGRYSGALALEAIGVGLAAIGVLDTAGPGYSLAAVIATEFRPIPLPLGFTLEGVGGLIGIHRRVDTDALRAALRTPAGLGDIFFPADPIAQAARLTGDLAWYFPAAEGRYVFGPAVKFGWGTPTMVRGTLAVLLELPAPARVVVLGTVTTKLPTEEHAIVDLAMDVVGEVDFGQKRVAVDASLRSSTIAGFPITGDLAFRMTWGSPRSFALAIGGFHSQFRPPADFPTLRRVRIELGSGDDPRLDAEGFLALTSNTLQMGARIDLYASAGPLNIVGGLGFETLVQFSPFGLAVDVWATVKLRRGTSTLAAVSFEGHLQGPKPWRVDGKACLSLWFIDLCVPIHVTFGHGAPATVPARQIWPALQAALAEPAAWAAEVPRGLAAAVVGTPVDADASHPRVALVDPCATLSVTQQVVPLDRTITAYAQGRPVGVDRFHVSEVRVGGVVMPSVAVTPVTAWFASAQFEAMSEADKLSRPGFEEMVAGVAVGAATVRAGAPLVRALDYDTVVIAGGQRQVAERYRPSFDQQLIGTALSATAQAPRSRGGAEAYAPPVGALPALTLVEETFVIATTDELAPRWDLTAAATRGEAELALRAHLAAHPGDAPRLQVVPSYEVAA